MKQPSLRFYMFLSIAAALITMIVKFIGYFLTGSVKPINQEGSVTMEPSLNDQGGWTAVLGDVMLTNPNAINVECDILYLMIFSSLSSALVY